MRRARYERKAPSPSLMRFERNARQTMLPTGSQVWTSLRRHRRQHIRRWSMRAQRSAIMFHVKPGVDRSHWPIQHVSARSTARTPFSHSLSRCMPPRDARRRVRSTQRCHDAGRTAATRRRGKEWRQTSRARIGSRRQHGAMPPVGSTQRHMVCTLPPTTDYQYRVPLFHVKPAAGCGLIRFLRRRASASWQERGPVPTETVAPMRVRPASV